MFESPEKYQPSEEEVSKADSMMTPSQRKLTSNRNRAVVIGGRVVGPERKYKQGEYDRLAKELGVDANLSMWEGVAEDGGDIIKGHINGHKIVLHSDGVAWIDDVKLEFPPEDLDKKQLLEKLFVKYHPLAKHGEELLRIDSEERELTEKARHEVQQQQEDLERADRNRKSHRPSDEETNSAFELAKDLLGEGRE